MQKLTHDKIAALLEKESRPAVTMYVPMIRSAAPPQISENRLRFKNMIHKAQEQLHAVDGAGQLQKELGELLDRYHDDTDFWKTGTQGLLICSTNGSSEVFSLPIETEEYIAVDDTYHLAPILALLSDNREYYVLALAQQHPKLFRGDMYNLEICDIGLPATMRSGLGIDEANQQSENQGSATGSSLNTGWFNGRGGARDPQDNDRMRLWHMIDKLLCDKADRSLPLILAGIDAENAEYRNISKYPRILSGSITGNNTETPTSELYAKAWDIVMKEQIEPEHAAAKEEYERLWGANPGRVARDTHSIEEAAEQGRIDKLLTMMSRRTTDTVQDYQSSLFKITFPEGDSGRMINKLAAKVWQMKGSIVSLLPQDMPHGAPMVARLRY